MPRWPENQRPANTLCVRLDSSYQEPLRQLAKSNRRTVTEEVKIALEEHFRKKGIWPEAEREEA